MQNTETAPRTTPATHTESRTSSPRGLTAEEVAILSTCGDCGARGDQPHARFCASRFDDYEG